jgi:exopolysaccharide biosynthesis polyprenyl glycosylphosphotransferase
MTTDRFAAWLCGAMIAGAAVLFVSHSHSAHFMVAAWPLLLAIAGAVIVERDSSFLATPHVVDSNTKPLVEPHGEAVAVPTKRVLIVGAGEVGRTLAESFEASGRYTVVGFVDDEGVEIEDGRWAILGGRDVTADIVAEHCIDEVVLAHAPSWKERLTHDMIVNHPEVTLRVVPTTYEALLRVGRVESHGDIAIADLVTRAGRATESTKRFFDVVAAVALLILSFPIAVLAAIAIKLTSPGPVIFAQERVGRYGELFTVFKFRTMVPNAEAGTGPILANGRLDDRLTKIGKLLRLTRIDELPQLWNVLCGEMSLVGPRPERPEFVGKFEKMNGMYAMRHQVRPGITGLAQICGGYHTSWRDKLRFDLIYVSHQSVWLDVSILVRTIWTCIVPKGHERKDD